MSGAEETEMTTGTKAPLRSEELREIELSVYGKLRAHRISDAWIDRHGEDAIQKGMLEYLRAVRRGEKVENRDAFVVRAAFLRALDELRHEARHPAAPAEELLADEHAAGPAAEELAVERVGVAELRRAMKALSPEERQILSLHYFEELSAAECARRLYCGETTYLRHERRALDKLAKLLGAPAPDPGSQQAIEIGLLAWVALPGAEVPLSRGPFDLPSAALDAAKSAFSWLLERARDAAGRATAGEVGEKLGAAGASSGGRVLGGCIGLAALCAATGAMGPGIGGIGLGGGGDASPPRVERQHMRPERPALHTPRPAPAPTAAEAPTPSENRQGQSRTADQSPTAKAKRERRLKTEASQVKRQSSGIERAASESGASEPTTSPAPEPAPTPSASPEGPAASGEEEQAEREFGAFK
jgi:RNA polymerase sigma factor (sigma-70 family)